MVDLVTAHSALDSVQFNNILSLAGLEQYNHQNDKTKGTLLRTIHAQNPCKQVVLIDLSNVPL